MNPIETVVMPLKADAMDRAEKYARASIAAMTATLEANGWDINRVAPRPRGLGMSRNEYAIAKGKHAAFASFTRSADYRQRFDDKVHIVKVHAPDIEHVVKLNRENAASQYDAFVAKLNQKCGEVTGATLVGSHVWDTSILTVAKADGTVQRWKTTMILNRSVHGKLFNQFPTRQMKN